EADDAERAGPAILDDDEEIDHSKPSLSAKQGPESEQSLATEGEVRRGLAPDCGRPRADPNEPGGPRTVPPGPSLGNRFRKAQEALSPLGESCPITLDTLNLGFLEDLDGKGDQTRVPIGD